MLMSEFPVLPIPTTLSPEAVDWLKFVNLPNALAPPRPPRPPSKEPNDGLAPPDSASQFRSASKLI